MPITYSIDVGVIDTGTSLETAIVELNDGFALGNYGLIPRRYAEISRDRGYEILKQKKG